MTTLKAPPLHRGGVFVFFHDMNGCAAISLCPSPSILNCITSSRPLPLVEREDDLIWIRQTFLNDHQPHPWVVVHGHTPAKQAEHMGNRVNPESGAAFGGPLSAAVFENGDC